MTSSRVSGRILSANGTLCIFPLYWVVMKTVLILYGGESSEHDVSISSARNVVAALDTSKYRPILGYLTKDGRLQHVTSIDDTIDGGTLLPVLGENRFLVEDTGESIVPDVIFPVLHGKNGEDGTVQGLAALLHIPIVGCGVAASAVAMNKVFAKQLAAEAGLQAVPYLTHRAGDETLSYDEVSESLGSPVFVKPANAGSSVGVTKVSDAATFQTALQAAHQHDDVVLIEKAIDARELEVAVLGNVPAIEASPVAEVVPEGDFYSYESKYAENSQSAVQIPAGLPEEVSEQVRLAAMTVFEVLECRGLARVDFFLDRQSGELYFNEINTLPGFTNISVYPKAWQAVGVSYGQLVDRLIQLALEK
ncbi:D-alanine--D-alanine ligase A [Candidatus Saccharibacteria bacterium]|nr:D-alanine--D-alanine ligase A [Candidatus Saccharibacteria bacterium]MBQ69048.1 D-alanine--D-alanine ligase A [Candidatus Saccharibacteria bacterium]